MASYEFRLKQETTTTVSHFPMATASYLTNHTLRTKPTLAAMRAYVADVETHHREKYGRPSYMGLAFTESLASGRFAYGYVPGSGKATYRFIGDDNLTYVVEAKPAA